MHVHRGKAVVDERLVFPHRAGRQGIERGERQESNRLQLARPHEMQDIFLGIEHKQGDLIGADPKSLAEDIGSDFKSPVSIINPGQMGVDFFAVFRDVHNDPGLR